MIDKDNYFKELHEYEKINYVTSTFTFSYDNLFIKNEEAKADVYMLHEYTVDKEDIQRESTEGVKYEFLLRQTPVAWKIVDVQSNDEYDRSFSEGKTNFKQMISDIGKPSKRTSAEMEALHKKVTEYKESIENLKNSKIVEATGWVASYLNDDAIVEYAEEYALNYNSLFKAYDGSDCQNFGSQCIYAGFGGNYSDPDKINSKAKPMSIVSGRYWWCTDSTSSYDDIYNHQQHYLYDPNGWTWSNVATFAEYMDDGGYHIEGPYGCISSGVNYAEVGDIVQIRHDPSDTEWFHTYIVTNVTGSLGSRTPSDITICSHTTDRKNVILSTINNNQDYYRTVEVAIHWHYVTE